MSLDDKKPRAKEVLSDDSSTASSANTMESSSDEKPTAAAIGESDANSRGQIVITTSQDRYIALRNHQIRFEDAIDPHAERVHRINIMDVVFGRGRGYQNHPGNKRMREIIEKYKTRYHSLKRDGKRHLVELVYNEISEGDIRFLKKLDAEVNTWVIVDRPIALQKVTHTLRCRKSIMKLIDDDGNVPDLSGVSVAASRTAGRIETSTASAAAGSMGVAAATSVPPGAGVFSGMGGLASMSAMGPSATISMAMPTPLATLEAQRLAALERYRALAGLTPAGGTSYYEIMRREQLLRETSMLQQMGDSLIMEAANAARQSNQAALLPEATTATTRQSLHQEAAQPSLHQKAAVARPNQASFLPQQPGAVSTKSGEPTASPSGNASS